MSRLQTGESLKAILAFGRQVSARDAFDDLVAAQGWQKESWQPSFVDSCDRERTVSGLCDRPAPPGDCSWERRQVLRRPPEAPEIPVGKVKDAEPRIMIASAEGLPSLYYVEWHYIDFVISCLGNISEAARVLGIRRSTLQRKRKKLPPSR
jgi:hypothetical protein